MSKSYHYYDAGPEDAYRGPRRGLVVKYLVGHREVRLQTIHQAEMHVLRDELQLITLEDMLQ